MMYKFSNGMTVMLGIILKHIDIYPNGLIIGETEDGYIHFSGETHPVANKPFNCIVGEDKSVIVWEYEK
jgi:hypothetical protein